MQDSMSTHTHSAFSDIKGHIQTDLSPDIYSLKVKVIPVAQPLCHFGDITLLLPLPLTCPSISISGNMSLLKQNKSSWKH